MYGIESEIVLAHVLSVKQQVSIGELKTIVSTLGAGLPKVCIDISKNSLGSAIEHYSRMFGWEDNILFRKDDSEEFFTSEYIDLYFNCNVHEDVREFFLKVMGVIKGGL